MIKSALLKHKIKIGLKRILNRKVVLSELALSFLKPGDNIFEAGAHIGWDTVKLAALTNGTVYAFEPVPDLYHQLEQKAVSAKNIKAYRLALGSENGTVDMYLSSGSSDASSSLLKPKEHFQTNPDVFFDEKITVPVQTLDTWAQKNGGAKLDFMWLDMQGMELAMLKHGANTLSDVQFIYTEVSELELYENQASYSQLKAWLIEKGFSVFKEEMLWGHTGNVLFKRVKK